VLYCRELKTASTDALAGKKFTQEIGVDKVDKSLVANFEILNLVPERSTKEGDLFANRSESGEFMGSPELTIIQVIIGQFELESLFQSSPARRVSSGRGWGWCRGGLCGWTPSSGPGATSRWRRCRRGRERCSEW
jgi:hypothetical protein